MAVRIGITGHRAERLAKMAQEAGADHAQHEQRLADTLASVFDAIETAMLAFRATPAGLWSDQPPLLSVLVGAAFGVDRIAARIVSARRDRVFPPDAPPRAAWRLEAVLPAPLILTAEAALPDFAWRSGQDASGMIPAAYAANWSRFLGDCDTVTTLPAVWRAGAGDSPRLDLVAQFAPAERIEGDYRISYVVAADFQLKQFDLLIAVWDGKPSRGPGGVADIVAHAHAAGMPVVVVDATKLDRAPAMLRTITFGPERPNIIGWSPEPLDAVMEAADCRDEALGDAVRSVLDVPPGDGQTSAAHGASKLTIEAFLRENSPRRRPLRVYDWFVRLLGGTSRSSSTDGAPATGRAGSGWTGWAEAVRGEAVLSNDLAILRRRYAAASALANDYASRYRSTFVLAFGLGAMAASFAVVGQAFNVQRLLIKAALISGELLLIVLVVLVIRIGRGRHYHTKYIEYRSLAESLYGLRFLSVFGEALSSSGRGREHWTDWYTRCTARELAMPNLALDATFQRRVLKAVCEYEVEPQIAYHEANAERMQAVEHKIHRIGDVMFATVLISLIALCALWAAESVFDYSANPLVTGLVRPILNIVAAFFPTAGAALAGIRFMADFDGRAIRSRDAAAALRRLGQRADTAQHAQQFSTTREILHDLAATLTQDVKLFHENFSRRQLTLPG